MEEEVAISQLRLAILQRICPGYRTALFSRLSSSADLHVKLFIGESIPNSKVNNAPNLEGIRVHKLKTGFFKFGHRVLPWHSGLVKELRNFKPDVILCEGESHFLGYLQALWYKLLYGKKTALIHWCFISLPGEPVDKSGIVGRIKRFFRNQFDAFLLYSSFSKERLVKLGISSEKAFVATNVGDVKKFLGISDSIKESAAEARRKLSLKERFTVLYTGTLDRNKRPEMMLDLAGVCDAEKFNFVLLGAGEMLEELRERAVRENLSNVYLPGRVTDSLAHYFRASDVLLVPGRGGIVISEGMAFGLPVVTYQADGTEYDLIQNQTTGFILEKGDLNDFREKIEFLQNDIKHSAEMGKAGRQLVENQFTTDNMVNQILKAARYAKRQALAGK